MILNKKKLLKQTSGFTLVEILVASVILFTSIAMVSMVYRGAYISSDKADGHINITGVLPAVLATIRDDIRAQGNSNLTELKSEANMWDVNYQWQASLLQHKSPPKKYDLDSGSFMVPAKKYKLWQVDLTLKRNNLVKQYQFKELSWLND
ncbi:PulJ/GspJ family protein [Pseudoalteromonas denitrificans]|nr:type II secretion system protein [Pseudoalteromonas denitrificans]